VGLDPGICLGNIGLPCYIHPNGRAKDPLDRTELSEVGSACAIANKGDVAPASPRPATLTAVSYTATVPGDRRMEVAELDAGCAHCAARCLVRQLS